MPENNMDFDKLFNGGYEFKAAQSEGFLPILALSEELHRDLMGLVLSAEIRREANVICGLPEDDNVNQYKIPAFDYISEAKNKQYDLFLTDEMRIASFGQLRDWPDGNYWTGIPGDATKNIASLINGPDNLSFIISIDTTKSRDRQIKQLENWFKIVKSKFPSGKSPGPLPSFKSKLISLAYWRIWLKTKKGRDFERSDKIAKEVARKLLEFLPQCEAPKNFASAKTIKGRGKTIWSLIEKESTKLTKDIENSYPF